ncbi:unnamed protein product [Adineta steineri]|uniref:Uncharacterized protein n=1 Tax=Adineta steineri TaxID=433720 RepID=A0A815EMT8_9BILA|nr:unnamed protein product [Adineta steineri]
MIASHGSAETNFVSMITIDLNEDNKTDIIVGSYDYSVYSIMIFLNSGSDIFIQSKRFPVSDAPSSISTGDINNDNTLDIVVVSKYSTNIYVFLNAGNGTFIGRMTISIEFSISDFKIIDFNKDGKLDFIITTVERYYALVLLNDGNGIFTNHNIYSTVYPPIYVEVIDVNGDNMFAIITTHLNGHITIFSSTDNSTIMKQVSSVSRPTFYPITTNDINSDNKVDIIITVNSISFVVIFNFGNGTFSDPITYFVDSAGDIVTGDLNNDGKADIICVDSRNSKITTYFNTGNGTFIKQRAIPLSGSTHYATTNDFNDDGKMDIIVADSETIIAISFHC